MKPSRVTKGNTNVQPIGAIGPASCEVYLKTRCREMRDMAILYWDWKTFASANTDGCLAIP